MASLARTILEEHLVRGELVPGQEIAIAVDQALVQDATGTMAAILLTNRDGSSRFRSGLGIQELADRAVPDGRITERLVVAWIVMVVLVVFALWLDPAPFPLPRP